MDPSKAKMVAITIGVIEGILFSLTLFLSTSFPQYTNFLDYSSGIVFIVGVLVLYPLKIPNYFIYTIAPYTGLTLILVNKHLPKNLMYILLLGFAVGAYFVLFGSRKRKAIIEGTYKGVDYKPATFKETIIPLIFAWPLSFITVFILYYVGSVLFPETVDSYINYLMYSLFIFYFIHFTLLFYIIRKIKNKT